MYALILTLFMVLIISISANAHADEFQKDNEGRVASTKMVMACPDKRAAAIINSNPSTKNRAEHLNEVKIYGAGCKTIFTNQWLYRKLDIASVSGMSLICVSEYTPEDCLWMPAENIAIKGSIEAQAALKSQADEIAKNIKVRKTVEIKYGKLEFIFDGNNRTSQLKLNGNIVTTGEENFDLDGYYELSTEGVIIIEDGCAGSGCPIERKFLIVKDGGKFENKVDIKSGTKFIHRVQGDEVLIDLGYVDKRPTVAKITRGNIEYSEQKEAMAGLPKEDCRHAVELLDVCQKSLGPCTSDAYDILSGGGGRASAGGYIFYAENPNFNTKEFDVLCKKACLAKTGVNKSVARQKICFALSSGGAPKAKSRE